ncbi:hypothetical protein D3C81_957340 [compost metagenome]
MRIYIPDDTLPVISANVLALLGLSREDFIQNVIYGELTRDPYDYDASVVCSMDDFLIQNLTNHEYERFMRSQIPMIAYEADYIRVQQVIARYLKRIDFGSFDMRLFHRGYGIELNSI